jgi:hypothetical protein
MRTVIYTGYAYTGGSIIGDILREIDLFSIFADRQVKNSNSKNPLCRGIEFRLLKEHYGICDLDNALFKSYDPEIVDLAIKDFKWLCEKFARPQGFFRPTGFGYDQQTNKVFSKLYNEYIDSLIDFRYPKSWHFYDFSTPYFKLIFWRLIKRITKNNKYGNSLAALAYPDRLTFLTNTRAFIEKTIYSFLIEDSGKKGETIALGKAILPYSYEQISQVVEYFDECKVIIVDRDPRDVFCELLKYGKGRYLPVSNNPHVIAEGFIKFYKSIRINQETVSNHQNVLLLKFEDICFNSNESLNKIYKFLEIKPSQHKQKGSHFYPKMSKENIGLWKESDALVSEVIKIIEQELPEYLYQPITA